MGNEEKVNLKLTPRNIVFRTKQLKSYRDYIRSIKEKKATVNEVESDMDAFEVSALQVDEDTASYVGDDLAQVAALAQLPPQLPDTPLDVTNLQEDTATMP